MAVVSDRPPANGFVRSMRKVYNPVGFAKGYNFVLWFIFSGALMGFCLARSPTAFNFPCRSIGAGHAESVIPAGMLACFQFVPFIRHKLIIFHRINGYLVVTLSLISTIGALMVAKVSFGGGLDIQTLVGVLAIMFLGSLGLAMYNIKRLQIEQHRAWMLRAWFYSGSIITTRLIIMASTAIMTMTGTWYHSMPCEHVQSLYENSTEFLELWPDCNDTKAWVAVDANFPGPEGGTAGLNLSAGPALWLALAIHTIGVEVYLHLTPAEFERLRNVSYQRQLEAGFKNPGRGGLTVDRLGDSETWVPAKRDEETTENASSSESSH